jgi:hypothetical protein
MSQKKLSQEKVNGGSWPEKKESANDVLMKVMNLSSASASEILELYHYTQESDIKQLVINYAKINGSDRLVIWHLAKRMAQLSSMLKT